MSNLEQVIEIDGDMITQFVFADTPDTARREQTRARYPDAEGYLERDGVCVYHEVHGTGEQTEARAYAADHMGAVSPLAVPKTAAEELIALVPVLRRLPRRFDRVTSALEQGRLSLNVRLFADERDRRVITGLTYQVLLTVLTAASGITAALLLGVTSGPKITQNVGLGQLIGYNLLVVAGILGLRVLYAIFRNREPPGARWRSRWLGVC
jgi:hypothetical protein